MTSLSRPGAARSPAMAERLQTLRRLPDRPALTAAVSGLLALLFMGAVLLSSDGDISRLVHAGPPWTSARTAPGSLTVQAGDEAFDGQFFYRLGVSPLSTERSVSGVRFDLPALRNARWLYGGLAWLGSGGDPDLVPWALAAINLAAAVAVGGLAGALARDSAATPGSVCCSRCIRDSCTRCRSTPASCWPPRSCSPPCWPCGVGNGRWRRWPSRPPS